MNYGKRLEAKKLKPPKKLQKQKHQKQKGNQNNKLKDPHDAGLFYAKNSESIMLLTRIPSLVSEKPLLVSFRYP